VIDDTRLQPVAVKVLDQGDPFQGLTPKQYRFVTLSFSGLSDIEAYRQAYDCSGLAPGTIGQKAAEIMRLPLVRGKLRSLREETDRQSTLAPSLSREWILNGIMSLALKADKDSTRLNAYIALGKTAGIDLFREVHVTEKRVRTAEDVERELKDRLGDLARTIEARANPEPAPPSQLRDRRRKPKA